MRYAGLAYSEHLTDYDLLNIAAERGLAFGVLGSRALNAASSWLGQQYELNEAALRDLDFADDEDLGPPPEFDELLDTFGMANLIAFDRRRQLGFQDDLVIAPSIGAVGLRGADGKPGYIERFDRKQGSAHKTGMSNDVWSRLTEEVLAGDPLAGEGWTIAMVLDSGSDLAERARWNGDAPKGLLYTGMNADDQRAILATDKKDKNPGEAFELGSVTIAQIILINAKRRLQGLPLLDDISTEPASFTRLVQYGDITVNGGEPQVLSVASEGPQLQLGASKSKEGLPLGGIREAIQVVSPAISPEDPEDHKKS